MSKKLYLIGAALALYAQTNAQISLVKNMQAGDILEIKQSGNQLFYTTASPTPTLWASDGTPNGTNPVASFTSPITGLTVYNNRIYFVSNDTSGNLQLFGSDGTTANTKVVKKINPSGTSFDADTAYWRKSWGNNIYSLDHSAFYSQYLIRVMNSKMYFMASDGVHGRELWSSDGTDAGTTMVKDINLAPNTGNYPFDYSRTSFEVMNNKLYFYASDGGTQTGLWTSDGTSAGTTFVTHISFGSPYPDGNRLFFTGWVLDSSSTDHGVYVTDGTDTGTHLVVADASIGNIDLVDYATVNNDVYFMTRRDSNAAYLLYKTDGTAAGTVLLKNPNYYNPGSLTNYNRHPFHLTAFNNKVYYAQSELWVTDGTPSGTQVFKDLTPYLKNGIYQINSYPGALTVAGNKLYLKAQDTIKVDVWISDGTDTGTHIITDPNNNYSVYNVNRNLNSLQSPMIPFASSLYFSNFYDTTIATEFYKLDITPTSVNNLSSGVKTVSLYPNPANQTIAVKGIKVQDFVITDITGKMVLRTSTNEAFIATLPSGMYVASITATDGIRYAGKFVKQ